MRDHHVTVCFSVLCVMCPHSRSLSAGVFNVVTGNGAFGQSLATHPDVDKVGFTGSTEVMEGGRRRTLVLSSLFPSLESVLSLKQIEEAISDFVYQYTVLYS